MLEFIPSPAVEPSAPTLALTHAGVNTGVNTHGLFRGVRAERRAYVRCQSAAPTFLNRERRLDVRERTATRGIPAQERP